MARPEWKQVGGLMSRNEWLIIGGAVALSVVAGLLTAMHANAVLTFVVSGVALALLAALVGMGTEQLGSHLGPGATGSPGRCPTSGGSGTDTEYGLCR